MEEARRNRLEKGDGALEDATTKMVEGTAKLARTMTMVAVAPVAAVLENEQVKVRKEEWRGWVGQWRVRRGKQTWLE